VVFKIGLLGLGTVGTGVAKILLDRQGRHSLLGEMEITRMGVRSPDKPREVDLPTDIFTADLESIVTDPAIDIVVELIGGTDRAYKLIMAAIDNRKHIVTANKAVIARYGAEIFTAAKEKGVYVMIEASVCGGIPVIQALKQALGANRIKSVMGIVNGTTNYILTRMHREGGDFEPILAEAQKLGYAEADPTADVDGLDAADKMAILASLAFGDRIKLEDIYCEGIRNITSTDIAFADEMGYVIKLLGIAQHTETRGEEALDIRVHPVMVPASHALASIHGVTNAVRIEGDPIGELVLSGPGAGSGATASAVVADMINVVATLRANPTNINLTMGCTHQHYAKVQSIAESQNLFYVRLVVLNQPGVIGAIGTCFGKHKVSLESIVQKHIHDGMASIAVITQKCQESNFRNALAEIGDLGAIDRIPTVIRLLDA
jgi:homoserine dehydrogenase